MGVSWMAVLGQAAPENGEGVAKKSVEVAAEAAKKLGEDAAQKVGQVEAWVRKYGPDVVTVLVILIVAWFLSGWAKRATRKALDRAHFDLTASKFFANLIRWSILAVAVVISLSRFGIETATFAALIAAMGLAIGLALQGTLSHLASGVMLLVFRPFKVGDGINVGGQAGTVNELDLFTTTLDTADGRRIIIPNGQIFGNTIENQTHHPRRRTDVTIVLAGSHDVDHCRRVLLAAAQGTAGVLMDPHPDVVLTDLPGGNMQWSVQAWAKTGEVGGVRQTLLKNLRDALAKEGLGGPRQALDVSMKQG